jgi:hypothetical protein
MDNGKTTDGNWHAMFDRLCMEQGHLDCKALAGEYCEFVGKGNDAAAFDAAIKSLNNWRQGNHTPTRRNFRILTVLLGVSDHPDVQERWNALYEDALRRDPAAEDAETEQPLTPSKVRPLWTAGAAAVLAGLAVAAYFIVAPMQNGEKKLVVPSGPPVIDMTGQRIYWREESEVAVGESVVIHGKRGNRCAAEPPPWEDVLAYLPQLTNGVWSDGGVGFRISRSCGGATPARAVVFTATRPGVEKFMLYEDPITITVR